MLRTKDKKIDWLGLAIIVAVAFLASFFILNF
jgi:hypothetical protein